MKGYLIPALVSMFLFSLSVFAQQDQRLGRVYLEQAVLQYNTGSHEKSADLLLRAGEFLSDSSDIDYLTGKLNEKQPFRSGDPIEFYQSALALDNWDIYGPSDAVLALIPHLFQKKLYGEIIGFVSDRELVSGPGPDLLRMYAFSLNALDRREEAVRVLREALVLAPLEPDLYALLFRISREDRERYTGLLLDGLVKQPEYRASLLLSLLPQMSAQEPRRALLSLYDLQELFSLPVEVLRIQLTGLDSMDQLDKLAEKGLFGEGTLTAGLYESLPFFEQKNRLKALFGEFSGWQTIDENNDGVAELAVMISQGVPSRVDSDPDQNFTSRENGSRYRALYRDGLPHEIISRSPDPVMIRYEIYPWVREITVQRESRLVVYRIAPGNFSLPVNHWKDPFVPVLPDFPEPDWEKVQNSAGSVAVYVPGKESPLEEYIPYYGNTGQTTRYPAVRGDFTRTFFIREGVIVKAREDLIGSPSWDTIRYYDSGILRMITHDAQEDQFYEYGEADTPDGRTFYWDYDQNGFYDSRQTIKEGRILREYSSMDNGVYDILVEIEVPN